jgi:hypothetical protein
MYMKNNRKNVRAIKLKRDALILAILGSAVSAPAWSFDLDVGNSDIQIKWDTTVKGTSGLRIDERQGKIANNPSIDESDYKFSKGDFVSNRLDVLTELDFIYQKSYGFRVSGAGWYDRAYSDTSVKQNPTLRSAGYASSYLNNHYSDETKRYYRGPYGDLLDAFLFANTDVGDVPINLKIGKHTLYWGTSTFDSFQNGIAYGQAPLDARKAAAVPGSTLKELFMPVAQVSLQSQVASEWSVAGQWFLDWNRTRFPEGGTYFGGADFLFAGPDRFGLAPGVTIPRNSALTPKRAFNGSFGLSVSYSPDALPGTAISGYFRRFDDPAPWLAPQIQTSGGRPAGYRLVYPKDVRLGGFSVNTDVDGASVGIDASFRDNAPLVASGVSTVDNEGPRGRTGHINLNLVNGYGETPLYDTATLTAELSYMHLFEVTKHPELFRGVGYRGCATGSKWDGCATRDFVGATVRFEPSLLQVMPGVDLNIPLQVSYGVYGNGATTMSGNQGAFSYSIGAVADIRREYKVSLTWADKFARVHNVVNGVATSGNGSYLSNDRGWLSLSMQTTF